MLVTPFLGLKGNLEMTLASRLSTQANIGNMNNKREKWRICFGNLALDQVLELGLLCMDYVMCYAKAVLPDCFFVRCCCCWDNWFYHNEIHTCVLYWRATVINCSNFFRDNLLYSGWIVLYFAIHSCDFAKHVHNTF